MAEHPEIKKGARGGNASALGDGSTAIGGDAGKSGPMPGGRGGDAQASKPGVTAIGGRGGRGGAYEGMPGGDVHDDDVSADAMGVVIVGGMGGEAYQLDGRGGRGGFVEISFAPLATTESQRKNRQHMKRPFWPVDEVDHGRGGEGGDSIQYRARRLIIEMIKADYLRSSHYFTTEVWYKRDDVPLVEINRELARREAAWRVSIDDDEYVMTDLIS